MQPHELIRAQAVMRLTRTQFAEVLGVYTQMVSLWRTGRIKIPNPVGMAIELLMMMPTAEREAYINLRFMTASERE